MAAKKKRVDPIKQREKRAKIAAGIGLALFLALAAYEVPSMMNVLNKKPPPGANATDAGNRNPDGSIPLANVATAAAPTGITSSGELADTDVPPVASSDGQLVAFTVFQTKNPFTPQVSSAQAVPGTVVAPTAANKPGADVPGTSTTPATTTTPTATTPTSTTPLTPPVTTVPATTTPTPATAPTVSISVNGSVSRVGTGGTFPAGAPVFRLVSWSQGAAQIGIVGGSYATGGETLPLRLNQPVTLQNTHDGKQYKLVLISTP